MNKTFLKIGIGVSTVCWFIISWIIGASAIIAWYGDSFLFNIPTHAGLFDMLGYILNTPPPMAIGSLILIWCSILTYAFNHILREFSTHLWPQ